jgi:hypothetical protein
MYAPSNEEMLAAWEAELLSILDGDQFIERVREISDRRPWNMGLRKVAVRVAARKSTAFAATVGEIWPEVEGEGPPSKEAKKISPRAQPADENPASAQSKPAPAAAQVERRDRESVARADNAKRILDAVAVAKPAVIPVRRAEVRDWNEVQVPPDATALERLTYVPGLCGELLPLEDHAG